MALLDDIAAHLETEAVGTVGTDIFKGSMLDTHPDDVTVVYESAGNADEDTMGGDGSPSIRSANVQVRGRSGSWDYEAARTRVETARAALVKISNEDINGTRYLRVSQVNGPFPIRRDENDRWEFVANFDVEWLP